MAGLTANTERVRAAAFKKAIAVPGTSQAQALKAAGYSDSTINVRGRKLVRRLLGNEADKPDKLTLDDHLHRKGMSDEAIAGVLVDGLKANKIISAVIVGKDANERTNDFIEVPDHSVRGQYVDRVAKIRGYYPDPKLKIEHSGTITQRYEILVAQLCATPTANEDDEPDAIEVDVLDESAK